MSTLAEGIEIRRQPIDEPSVWNGKEMEQRDDWILHLDAAALRDIEHGLRDVQARHLATFDIGKDDFPLPSMAGLFTRIQNEVENGRGFVLVRGLPVHEYTKDEAEKIFWALGTHLGSAVSQNARGELISHVTNRGYAFGAKDVRGYETPGELFFHNDHGDMVGLLCLRDAKSGGISKLVSSTAMYNAILERHPEYIDELCRGYVYHMRGEHQPGQPEVTEHRVPVFSYHAGRMSSRIAKNAVIHGAAHIGQPLTARQREPLDFMDTLANELCMTMKFQPGDMQFVSNYSVLHARTAFEDHDEPERRRHLLRLWLNLPVARPLTYEFATRYGPGSARQGVPPVRDSQPSPQS
jgi:hypothetical protein